MGEISHYVAPVSRLRPMLFSARVSALLVLVANLVSLFGLSLSLFSLYRSLRVVCGRMCCSEVGGALWTNIVFRCPPFGRRDDHPCRPAWLSPVVTNLHRKYGLVLQCTRTCVCCILRTTTRFSRARQLTCLTWRPGRMGRTAV